MSEDEENFAAAVCERVFSLAERGGDMMLDEYGNQYFVDLDVSIKEFKLTPEGMRFDISSRDLAVEILKHPSRMLVSAVECAINDLRDRFLEKAKGQ